MKRADHQRDLHYLAFLNRVVQATDKKGNYIYKEFKDFYDEKKVLESLDENKQDEKRLKREKMARIAERVNKRIKEGG